MRGSPTKADLWLAQLADGESVVVKDFAAKPVWWRPWGRLQIAREARFLQLLAGIPGIPRLRGVIDADALAMEFIAGRPLVEFKKRPQGAAYFAQLVAILAAAHARGVIHNDLRGRENAHVAAVNDQVYVLDWAGAVQLVPGRRWHRLLFRHWQRIDQAALLKWKSILIPDQVSAADRHFLARYARWRRLWPFNRKGVGGHQERG